VLGEPTRLAVIEALPGARRIGPGRAAAVIAKAALAWNPHDRYPSGLRDRPTTRMLTILPTSVAAADGGSSAWIGVRRTASIAWLVAGGATTVAGGSRRREPRDERRGPE
jgi:hypothetical protein